MKTYWTRTSKWLVAFVIYLITVYSAITTNAKNVGALYLLILCYSFWRLPAEALKTVYKKHILVAVISAVVLYVCIFPYINKIELWGDEITEIYVASRPFDGIYEHVKWYYYASPPLGFWGLWVWNQFIQYTPIATYEFYYRVPYMFFHIAGAAIFGAMVSSLALRENTKSSELLKTVIFGVAFITFFINPITFMYSIEVRSYMISIVGSTVTLFFYLNPSKFRTNHIFLLYFFCLHAIVEFIIMLPFFVTIWIKRIVEKKEYYIVILTTLALGYIIKQNITPPRATSFDASYTLLKTALEQFITIQFTLPTQIVFILGSAVVVIRKNDKSMVGVIISILVFFFITAASAIHLRYYDFHVRHFSFIVPWILILIFSVVRYVSMIKKLLLLLAICIVFIIPWTKQTYKQLIYADVFSKSLKDMKETVQKMKEKNGTIIIFPNTNTRMSADVFSFYKMSYAWYADLYKVTLLSPSEESEACDLFANNAHGILLDITNEQTYWCKETLKFHQGKGVRYIAHE